MPDVFSQISAKFSGTTCKECGSQDIAFEFYAGFVHDCGGDTGGLSVICKNCGATVECDDS